MTGIPDSSLEGHPNRIVLEGLRARVVQALDPLVPPRAEVAVLDYPAHGNPGDTAIWLGTMAYLRRRGARFRYISSVVDHDPALLRRRLTDETIIVFHGGGNFGPMYPEHGALRESVVAEHRHNRVLLMPQTLELSERGEVDRHLAALASHSDLHALGRDVRSFEHLRGALGDRAHLSPDMATCLSLASDGSRAREDVLVVLRQDAEATGAVADVPTTDWRTWLHHSRRYRVQQRIARAATALSPSTTGPRVYDANARTITRAGLETLARGHVTVSDRLHVHILNVLLGRPHVVLDNSYGKVSGYYDAWTHDAPAAHFAPDLGAGLALAHRLAEAR